MPDFPLAGHGVIVHEWLETSGGSEKVFEAIAALAPTADLMCLWNDHPALFGDRPVSESILARTPLRRHKSLALPFVPAVWRRRRGPHGRRYDWSVVSSHQFAHQVRFRGHPADLPKFVYVHSPARYLWAPELDGRGTGLLPRLAAPPLKALDRRRAAGATAIAANSAFVGQRIQKAWHRESTVIHPPVDVAGIRAVPDWRDRLDAADSAALAGVGPAFVLGASRLIPYKRMDLVIRAGEAAGLPVVIAGSGPELAALQEMAAASSVPVTFLGRVSDALLFALYQRAVAYLFPAVEDFGMMPVEALAAGGRVIAQVVGGTAETITDGVTGVLTDFASIPDLVTAIDRVRTIDRTVAAASALPFDTARFAENFTAWLAREQAGA